MDKRLVRRGDSAAAQITSFVTGHYDAREGSVYCDIQPLRGGLESGGVARVRAHFEDRQGRRRSESFVMKVLSGRHVREFSAYSSLLSKSEKPISPRLLGSNRIGKNTLCLYMEWINPVKRWPWTETALVKLVMEQLAHIHSTLPRSQFVHSGPLAKWDYDVELQMSAQSTLDVFEQVRRCEELDAARPSFRAFSRIVEALPAIRREMTQAAPDQLVLHGDAHTGNVLLRARQGMMHPLLLDWSRTRLGPPMEDVFSWLQSLGHWEAEARRQHDSFLRHYLAARDLSTTLTVGVREGYWLAGACNGLAGAIRYHLLVATDSARSNRHRAEAVRAVADWMRIIRRADAAFRG